MRRQHPVALCVCEQIGESVRNHMQPRQLHAAKAEHAVEATTCMHMQPRQLHLGKAGTCSAYNRLQPRQPHAAKATTCSQGNRLQRTHLDATGATIFNGRGTYMHIMQPMWYIYKGCLHFVMLLFVQALMQAFVTVYTRRN